MAGIGVGCVEGGRLHRRLPQQERDDGVSAGRRHGAPRLQGLPQARQNGRGTRDLHTIFTSGAAVAREHDCVEPNSKLRISDLADLNICVSNHCKFDIWSSLKHNMKLSWGNQKIHIIVQSDITLIG